MQHTVWCTLVGALNACEKVVSLMLRVQCSGQYVGKVSFLHVAGHARTSACVFSIDSIIHGGPDPLALWSVGFLRLLGPCEPLCRGTSLIRNGSDQNKAFLRGNYSQPHLYGACTLRMASGTFCFIEKRRGNVDTFLKSRTAAPQHRFVAY